MQLMVLSCQRFRSFALCPNKTFSRLRKDTNKFWKIKHFNVIFSSIIYFDFLPNKTIAKNQRFRKCFILSPFVTFDFHRGNNILRKLTFFSQTLATFAKKGYLCARWNSLRTMQFSQEPVFSKEKESFANFSDVIFG